MALKALELKKITELLKKNPLFLDLKGKFLPSIVFSLPEKKIEGFLFIDININSYLFFLRNESWETGFQMSQQHVLPCDASNIKSLCEHEGARASFFEGTTEIVDILMDRLPDSSLMTQASMVNSSILNLLVEGAEKDRLTAYFKLSWSDGQIAYIVMKNGHITQRVFIDKEVIASDMAGQKIVALLEKSSCDISLYQLHQGTEKIVSQPSTDDGIEKSVKETFEADNEVKQQAVPEMADIPDKAEPLGFQDYYSNKQEDKRAEPSFPTITLKGSNVKSETKQSFLGSLFNKKQEQEEKQDGSVSKYSFPVFSRKSSDKIIKTVSDENILNYVKSTDELEQSKPSFKSHVLTSYFSLAESYENDGNLEKACSVLEEALEVPQIDRMAVYHFLLSVCRKNDALLDKELEILRRMSVEYNSDQQVLGRINRQIALIYVKKGKVKSGIDNTPKEEPPEKLVYTPPSAKAGFFSRIFRKEDKKK